MNQACLMGRLTKDPEVRYTQNNIAVCSFTLAVDRDYQKEGQEKEADFIPCIVWQKKGEAAGKFLEKGRRIGVAGRIQTRTWDDTDGKKHYVTEIVVNNWYFADDKRKEGAEQGQQQNNNQTSQTPPPENPSARLGGQQTNDLPPWMSR